jgi:hypothetical protein
VTKEGRERVERIRARIEADTSFALKVFREIHSRQKPEEILTCRHMGHDGKGFREGETVYLNALYWQLKGQGWRLTPEQSDEVRQRMAPYAGQFARAEQEHATSKQKSRKEAEKRGVGFSAAYDAARDVEKGLASRPPSRIRKLSESEKRDIDHALERMGA